MAKCRSVTRRRPLQYGFKYYDRGSDASSVCVCVCVCACLRVCIGSAGEVELHAKSLCTKL